MRALFSWRAFCFFTYGVVLTAFLAYVRFPSESFKNYFEGAVSQVLPGGECSVERISYHFPAGVMLEKFTIKSADDSRHVVLQLESLEATSTGWSFWRGVVLDGLLYRGTITAKLDFDWSTKIFNVKDLEGRGIDLSLWDWAFEALKRKTTGTLSLSGKYFGSLEDPLGGAGNGRWLVENGSMSLLQPVLSISELKVDSAQSLLKYESNVISISQGVVTGPELTGNFSGRLDFFELPGKNRIEIKGSLSPQPEFLQNHPREAKLVQRLTRRYKTEAVPFRIGGMVHRPTFMFGN